MSEQTPPAKDQKKVLPLEHQSYALYFALSGFLLVIVSLWAIWDETYARRPWKGYQQEFVKAAKPVFQKKIEDAKADLSKRQSELDYYEAWNLAKTGYPNKDPQFSALVAKVKAQFPEVKDAADPESLVNALRKTREELDQQITAKRKDFQLKRGKYAAAVWQYEVEPSNSSAKQIVDSLQKPIDEAAAEIATMSDKSKALAAAEAELKAPGDKARSKLASYEADKAAAERSLTALDNETIGIRQNFNSDLGPLGQIDRCESCHMGADRAGLDSLKAPFGTHSGDWLRTHPKDKFGCVSCHQGDGIATASVAEGHGEDPFWLTPMLPGKMMQAACYKCHETQVQLKGADTLMAGKRLYREVGCIGCHKIRGIGDDDAELGDVRNAIAALSKDVEDLAKIKDAKPEQVKALAKAKADLEAKKIREHELDREVKQVGPDLTGLKGKVHPGFVESWLQNPRKFRPTTRMPRFWPEPDTHDEKEREKILAAQMEEIRAISAYLWENSTDKVGQAQPPAADAGAVERGKNLVNTVGCKGCHNVDAEDAKLLGAKRFGPELSRVGEKMRPGWITAWVQNPKAMMPHSKMPNLRLDAKQAADIEAYLMTMKSKDLWPTEMSEPLAGGLKDDTARAALVSKGEKLIKHYGCFGCHTINGMEKQGKIGVELTVEGSKTVEEFDYGLLEHGLKAPRGGSVWEPWFKRQVSHEALAELGDPHSKKHISAHSTPSEWQAWLNKNIDKNTLAIVDQLFRPYRGTHEYPLTRQGYIATKLSNPRVFDTGKVKKPEERLKMPDFGLEPEEIFAITTFILANTADVDVLKAPWKDKPTGNKAALIEGQKVIEKNNCQGCHRFEKNLPPSTKALVAQMVHGFTPDKKISEQSAPKFQELDAQTLLNRMAFLKPDLVYKPGDKNAEKHFNAVLERSLLEGEVYPLHRKVMDDRNKAKAAAAAAAPKKPASDDDEEDEGPAELPDYEQLMGFNPPTLYYQGERAKPDWLFGFLKNVEPLRPWLEIRMPTFDLSDGDTRRLVAYFAAHENVDYPYATPVVQMPDKATFDKAGQIVQSCLACHKALPPNPSADLVAKSAPDLALAHRRLRADWMASWIHDPESYLPGTRMPQMFAYHGNAYPDFAGGDPVAQSRAVAAYLTTYMAGQGGAAPAVNFAPTAAPAPAASPAAPAPAASPAAPAPEASPAAPAPGASPAAAAPAAVSNVKEEPSDADKGTIKGVIKFEGTPPKMKKIRMEAEASCKAHHEAAGQESREETVLVNGDGTLRNVFVYIKSGPGVDGKTFETPKEPVILDQKGCQYIPHVWGIQQGQTLKILNSDNGVLHNIHTFSEKGQGFNKGMPGAPGVTLEERFNNSEVMVKVKCDVHGWMTGYCGVLPHPFYSVTGGNGVFYLRNVPPGDYEIEAWHEKYGPQTAKIKVEAGKVAEQGFSFKE